MVSDFICYPNLFLFLLPGGVGEGLVLEITSVKQCSQPNQIAWWVPTALLPSCSYPQAAINVLIELVKRNEIRKLL